MLLLLLLLLLLHTYLVGIHPFIHSYIHTNRDHHHPYRLLPAGSFGGIAYIERGNGVPTEVKYLSRKVPSCFITHSLSLSLSPSSLSLQHKHHPESAANHSPNKSTSPHVPYVRAPQPGPGLDLARPGHHLQGALDRLFAPSSPWPRPVGTDYVRSAQWLASWLTGPLVCWLLPWMGEKQ